MKCRRNPSFEASWMLACPTVILCGATRPISAESLYHCVDRRVEISGFGEKEVKKYITEYFASSNPSSGDKLLSTLSLRPHIERHCYVPLLLLMVCYIVSLDGDSAELRHTLHQLFEYLIILTLNHNLERAGRKERAGSIQVVRRLYPASFDPGVPWNALSFSPASTLEVTALFSVYIRNCIVTRSRLATSLARDISSIWRYSQEDMSMWLSENITSLQVQQGGRLFSHFSPYLAPL